MSEKIYYGEDGIRKEATGKVLEQILKDRAEYAEEQRLIEAEKLAKEEAKVNAMAKLTALGLNEDEVKAIVGA
jgi:hypothetical protein